MKAAPLLDSRLEVEALLSEWAWRVDEGKAGTAAELFCEDAEQNNLGVLSVGLAEITAALQRRQDLSGRATQHVISNLRITPSSDGLVHAQWVITLFRCDDPELRLALPFLIGVGRDIYRRGPDGQLRIWRREVRKTFGA